MDAVEFLKAYQSLCQQTKECEDCPLYDNNIYMGCELDPECSSSPESIVYIIEQWAKEHPTKTRQSEFLKMFPTSVLDDNGILIVSPCQVDESIKDDNRVRCPVEYCGDCRRNYWLQEVE